MLRDGELERMRSEAQRTLTLSATVDAYSRVSDGAGGFTDTYTPGAALDARIGIPGGGEGGNAEVATRGGRISDRTTHVITLPADTPVTEADRITLAGTTYEVTAVRSHQWEVLRQVEVREVE